MIDYMRREFEIEIKYSAAWCHGANEFSLTNTVLRHFAISILHADSVKKRAFSHELSFAHQSTIFYFKCEKTDMLTQPKLGNVSITEQSNDLFFFAYEFLAVLLSTP